MPLAFKSVIKSINERIGSRWSLAEITREVGYDRSTVQRVVWRLYVMGLVVHLSKGGPTQRRWSTTTAWNRLGGPDEIAETYEVWGMGYPVAFRLAGIGRIEDARQAVKEGV